MQRIVRLDPSPSLAPLAQAGARVVAPSRRAVQRQLLNSQSLEQVAQENLQRAGVAVAPPIVAHRLLQATLREHIPHMDPARAARFWAPAIASALRADLDLAQLAQQPLPRCQQLAMITLDYQARLLAQGFVDPSATIAKSLSLSRSSIATRRPLLVFGYLHLSRPELALIDALADNGSLVVLPYQDHALFQDNLQSAQFLQRCGWDIQIGRSEGQQPARVWPNGFLQGLPIPEHLDAVCHPHLEAEVRGALKRAKAFLADGVPASDMVLVARNDQLYGPLILDVAWEYDLPVHVLYQIPLVNTRLGAWLTLATDAIRQGFPFEACARLLAHPIGPSLSSEQWQQARLAHPRGHSAWDALGCDLTPLVWPDADSPSGWWARLQRLFHNWQIKRRCGEWARELLAFHRLQDGLNMWRKHTPEPSLSLDAFLDQLQEILNLYSVAIHPGRGGVELHTPLSLAGSQYRHVMLLGNVEGLFPKAIQDDPILDFFSRKQLAAQGFPLETTEEAARQEARLFWSVLQNGTESLYLSHAQMVQGKAALPSVYQRCLQPRPDDSFRTVASPEELRQNGLRDPARAADDVTVAARHAWQVESRREGQEPFDDYDGVTGRPVTFERWHFSASQLTALGQCPFRWWASYALGLRTPDEAQDDLGVDIRGSLYHAALEIAAKKAQGCDDIRQGILEHLEAAFLEAEQALPRLPAWEARRPEHVAVLRRAVLARDFLQTGATILDCETAFRGTWNGLPVKGRIDRVDETAEGIVLVDYKTSSHAPAGIKDAEGACKVDLQVTLYREAAAPALFPERLIGHPYYYSLTKGKILKPKSEDSDYLKRFAREVQERLASGNFPVLPDEKEVACQYCDLDPVCRKGPRISRKQAQS